MAGPGTAERLLRLSEPEQALRAHFRASAHPVTTPQLRRDAIADLIADPAVRAVLPPGLLRPPREPESIPEAAFMDPAADVAVVRHLRYLPAMTHAHDFVELSYVYCGGCRHFVRGMAVEMTGGDVSLVGPGTAHTVAVFEDESVVVNVLVRRSTFDTAFFGLLTEDDVLSRFFTRMVYGADRSLPFVIFRSGDDATVRGIVEDLYEEATAQRRYRDRMLRLLVQMLCTALIREHAGQVSVVDPMATRRDDRMVLALSHIQANFRTATLPDVAARFGYSEAHFSRLVKAYTDRTFSDILREIRVQRAAALLRNESVAIGEIVEAVGYADTSHFYRSFRRYFGETPAEYRRRARTAPDDGSGPGPGDATTPQSG